jgi:hypothetical protein
MCQRTFSVDIFAFTEGDQRCADLGPEYRGRNQRARLHSSVSGDITSRYADIRLLAPSPPLAPLPLVPVIRHYVRRPSCTSMLMATLYHIHTAMSASKRESKLDKKKITDRKYLAILR